MLDVDVELDPETVARKLTTGAVRVFMWRGLAGLNY